MAKKSYDLLFKLLLFGDSGVGKTCLLSRFSDDAFNASYISTIGIDFMTKTVEVGGKKIKFQIWDTAGQERFRTVTTSCYHGAMGIMLVYDINNSKTFDNIKEWLCEIDMHANKDVVKMILGNKCDMEGKRQISRERGKTFAKEHGIPFLETSAKANINVDKAFMDLAQAILNKREKAAKEAELSGLQQDKTKADGEVSRLQRELKEKDRQTKEKEEEVSRLKEHGQSLETEIGRMTSKHVAEVRKLKEKEKRLKKSLERKEGELKDAMVEMREKVHVLMKDLKQQQSLDHNDLVSRVQELQEVDTLIATSVDSIRTLQASHYDEMTEYRQDLAKAAQSHPDNQALSHLPQDVQELCHQIHTLIGGNKNKFARKLLGEKFTESPSAVGFATGKDFWKLIDAWTKLSQQVTRAELEKACEGLHPDPLSTREMSQSDRQRLERHFLLLRERVLVSSLVDALRTSGLLTEDARLYLLEDPLPRSQRTARLCDVIVSWGERGLPALVKALKESDQVHVAIPLEQSQDQELLPRNSTSVEEGQSQTSPRGAEASFPQMPEESLQEGEDTSRPVSVQDLEKVMEKNAGAQ